MLGLTSMDTDAEQAERTNDTKMLSNAMVSGVPGAAIARDRGDGHGADHMRESCRAGGLWTKSLATAETSGSQMVRNGKGQEYL